MRLSEFPLFRAASGSGSALTSSQFFFISFFYFFFFSPASFAGFLMVLLKWDLALCFFFSSVPTDSKGHFYWSHCQPSAVIASRHRRESSAHRAKKKTGLAFGLIWTRRDVYHQSGGIKRDIFKRYVFQAKSTLLSLYFPLRSAHLVLRRKRGEASNKVRRSSKFLIWRVEATYIKFLSLVIFRPEETHDKLLSISSSYRPLLHCFALNV